MINSLPSLSKKSRLLRPFFEQPTVIVAQELLGKRLLLGSFQGIITETEAYRGEDDPACHAAKGRRTSRTEVMYGQAGCAYVYFIYGMYYCLNIVTEAEGFPAAVLIRGLLLEEPYLKHLNGPGKLCRDLKITKSLNYLDFTVAQGASIEEALALPPFIQTSRIGIRLGTEKLWRYVIESTYLTSYIRSKYSSEN